jgi:hypothetical protein
VSDAIPPIDPVVAARLTQLEAVVAAQQAALATGQAALEAERALRAEAEAERDRLRAAYQALQLEVELARRRLVIAKAERVDTTQLELEFASKLAALDVLAGLVADEEAAAEAAGGPDGPGVRRKRKGTGRRDLHKAPVGEERLEITDPSLEGKAERMGAEESCALVWRRGGFVRLVIARIKYRTTSDTDAAEATSASAAPAEPAADTAAAAEPTAASPAVAAEPAAGPPATDEADGTGIAYLGGAPAIVTAPMPPRLLERSYATPSLLAHIASDKFCDGLPLHRQQDRFERLGVPLHRSTMCRWLEEVGAIVGATIVEAMRKEALATAFCIATDATGVLVQPERGLDKKRQPCRRAHFFVQIADADHVFFEYTPVETSQVVSEMFRGFSGYVQADAKSVYDILFRPAGERDRVGDDRALRHEVACWSHARTGLWEAAVATQTVIAREGLARIMRMFQLERLWMARTPDERKELRDRHLRPHLVSFFEFAEEQFALVEHQRGMLRSALGYCVRQKQALQRFLDDGRLEMTNNRSERQLRRVACGRKAWLFVGSDDHGQASGNLLTLIASARLHRLDPEVYLRDVFRVLPYWPRDRYLELAPRYWRITRARLDRDELGCELGPLTIPEPPLPTAMPAYVPAELRPAP